MSARGGQLDHQKKSRLCVCAPNTSRESVPLLCIVRFALFRFFFLLLFHKSCAFFRVSVSDLRFRVGCSAVGVDLVFGLRVRQHENQANEAWVRLHLVTSLSLLLFGVRNLSFEKSGRTLRTSMALFQDDVARAHFSFKVSIVGDRHTGKSNMLRCMRDFAPGQSTSKIPTLMSFGINHCRQMYAMNEILFDVLFEDAVTPLDDLKSSARLLANSAAAVIVFDITRRSSFDHVADWMRLAKSLCQNGRQILVGTRHNLKKRRSVPKSEARDLAAASGCAYVELSVESPNDNSTSARTQLHDGVKFAFDSLALEVIQHLHDPPTIEALRGSNVRTESLYEELNIPLNGATSVLQASPKRGSLLPPSSRDSQRSRIMDDSFFDRNADDLPSRPPSNRGPYYSGNSRPNNFGSNHGIHEDASRRYSEHSVGSSYSSPSSSSHYDKRNGHGATSTSSRKLSLGHEQQVKRQQRGAAPLGASLSPHRSGRYSGRESDRSRKTSTSSPSNYRYFEGLNRRGDGR